MKQPVWLPKMLKPKLMPKRLQAAAKAAEEQHTVAESTALRCRICIVREHVIVHTSTRKPNHRQFGCRC